MAKCRCCDPDWNPVSDGMFYWLTGTFDVMSELLADIPMPIRARKAFARLDIKTVGELCQLCPWDLMAGRGCGDETIAAIRVMLAERGLTLRSNVSHMAKAAHEHGWDYK